MISFIIAIVVIVAVVLLILFRPFIFRTQKIVATRAQLNTEIYQEEMAKLDRELTNHQITADDYQQAKNELKLRLLDENVNEEKKLTSSSNKKLIAALSIGLPILAGGLYYFLGNTDSLSGNKEQQAQQASQRDFQVMVDGLAKKLEKDPDNIKGWIMLSRSYKVLKQPEKAELARAHAEQVVNAMAKKLENTPDNNKGWVELAHAYKMIDRPLEAEKAFDRAGTSINQDAQQLADYADVVATNAKGSFVGKPTQLIKQALAVDPNNTMALWLAGTAAYNANQLKEANQYWEHLLTLLPPDSDDAQLIQGSLKEIHAKLNLPDSVPSGTNGADANTTLTKDAQAPKSAEHAGASISGVVQLDETLQSKTSPSDTVMIVARAPNVRMPVAVKRAQISDLPLKFTLDDSNAMTPELKLSSLSDVSVEVRISKTGQAKAELGDLYAEPKMVKVGEKDINLKVNKIRQ